MHTDSERYEYSRIVVIVPNLLSTQAWSEFFFVSLPNLLSYAFVCDKEYIYLYMDVYTKIKTTDLSVMCGTVRNNRISNQQHTHRMCLLKANDIDFY